MRLWLAAEWQTKRASQQIVVWGGTSLKFWQGVSRALWVSKSYACWQVRDRLDVE